jgi:hypothetical protein
MPGALIVFAFKLVAAPITDLSGTLPADGRMDVAGSVILVVPETTLRARPVRRPYAERFKECLERLTLEFSHRGLRNGRLGEHRGWGG